MKILILNPWCDDIHIETLKGNPLTASLLDKMLEHNHEIKMFCTQGEIPAGKNYCKIHKISFLRSLRLKGPLVHILNVPLYFYNNFLIYKRLKNLVIKENVDIILSIANFGAAALKLIAKEKRIPLVLLIYGVWEAKRPFVPHKFIPYFSYIFAFFLKPDLVVAVNDGSDPVTCIKKFGVKGENIFEIPNPLPIWNIQKSETSEAPTIGYFSRFGPEKQTMLFIEMAKATLTKFQDSKFLITGCGSRKFELKMRELCRLFPGRVDYKGWIDYKDMPPLYEKIDILVSTTRYGNATLPVIEAQVSGIPVVVFDVADTRKFVIEGKTGFNVPLGDVNGFIDKLGVLINDKVLRENMGKNAKELAGQIFPDIEKWTTSIVDKLEKLCPA